MRTLTETSLTAAERAALEEFCQTAEQRFPQRIARIILFGSKARGDFTQESDIDLLVLTVVSQTPEFHRELEGIACEVALLKRDILISLKWLSLEQYEHQKKIDAPFVRNIEQEGIVLWNRP